MNKLIFLTIPMLLLWSCQQEGNNHKSTATARPEIKTDSPLSGNVYWYKNQIIEQVIKETDSVYVVQIGMMAQSFQLQRQHNTHFDEDLKLLQQSLAQRTKLNIGITNGTNNIIAIVKVE